MKGLASIVLKISILTLIVVLFSALSWLGIMPLKAVHVMLNTVFIGAALFLLADIMISSRMAGRE